MIPGSAAFPYSILKNPEPMQNITNLLVDQQQSWDPDSYIDWNYINELDPFVIKKTKDIESLQEFMRVFAKTQISIKDAKVFNHPLAPKLFLLLQVMLDYLLYCQNKLSSKLHQKTEENKKMKKKLMFFEMNYKKLETSNKALTDAYNRQNRIIEQLKLATESCPVCHKRFREGNFLDKHIEKKHNELYCYWKVLKTQQPANVANKEIKELIDQIKELKKQTRKQYNQKSKREEINAQLNNSSDDLDSSMILYKQSKKNNKKPNINPENPFAQFSKVQMPQLLTIQPVPQQSPHNEIKTQENNIQREHQAAAVQENIEIQAQPNIISPNKKQVRFQLETPEINNNVKIPKENSDFEEHPNIEQNNEPSKPNANNPTFVLARNFLNPQYREAKYRFTDEQMEKMISSVSQKIQNEIVNIKNERQVLENQIEKHIVQPKQIDNINCESQSLNKKKHLRKKKHKKVVNEAFIINSSMAEYSPPINKHSAFEISDEENIDQQYSYVMDESEIDETSQSKRTCNKSNNKVTLMQKSQENIDKQNHQNIISDETNSNKSNQKEIKNAEEQQNNMVIGVKFIQPFGQQVNDNISEDEYNEQEDDQNPFEISNQGEELMHENNQPCKQTSEYVKITNEELNELLEESYDSEEEHQETRHNSFSFNAPIMNETQDAHVSSSVLNSIMGSAASEKEKLSIKPNESKYIPKITNSEIEDLLHDSFENSNVSKQLSPKNDTFLRKNSISNKITQDDIDELLNDADNDCFYNTACDPKVDNTNIIELPKPKNRCVYFDLQGFGTKNRENVNISNAPMSPYKGRRLLASSTFSPSFK